MSEWWDRYLFDDLIGLEAAAVTSDGSRHIGPFVRFGDYLTVDDTCVFTRKDKGDGVRLMEEVDHVRLRPEEPFWQGRFLDELEGVRVRVEFGGRRGAFEGPLEPFDGVLGIRAGGRGLEYVFGDSGYRFAQPGFVRVRPVEDQPDEPVPAVNASRLVESRTLLRVARRQLAETESLLAESFSRMPRLSEADARRSENRRHDIEDRLHELRELIGEQSYDLNSIESKGQNKMNDGKRQVTDETEPDENPIATIHYENGTELTGKAVTLQDGTVGVRIPNEFFKTALLPDGSMPDGVLSVDIGPKHVEGGLPLTDDMVCMAVTAMLRDAVGLTSGEASDAYETWLNRAKRATIEHWVDSLPTRESTRLHCKYLDRDGADYPKEKRDA